MAEGDDSLMHYGVKGMRWGVSKGVINSRNQRTSKENKVRNTRKDARKRRQVLSDKNLDQLVKRLEQEKKLKSLLDEDLSPGRTATKKLLSNVGTKVAGTVLAGAGVWAVKTSLEGGFAKRGFVDKATTKATVKALATSLASNVPKIKK